MALVPQDWSIYSKFNKKSANKTIMKLPNVEYNVGAVREKVHMRQFLKECWVDSSGWSESRKR
jgi:hypothetical protein